MTEEREAWLLADALRTSVVASLLGALFAHALSVHMQCCADTEVNACNSRPFIKVWNQLDRARDLHGAHA
jgi:hypothetical protein